MEVPYFVVEGKNAVGMAACKKHAPGMVCSEESADGAMGSFGKLTSVDELPPAGELKKQGRNFAKAVQSPKTSKPKPKPRMPMPDDFGAALARAKGAMTVWDCFTDAHRRDCLNWVTSAKREATREKLIATAVEWIVEAKRRNWKYENCGTARQSAERHILRQRWEFGRLSDRNRFLDIDCRFGGDCTTSQHGERSSEKCCLQHIGTPVQPTRFRCSGSARKVNFG